ncbi:methyltransferase domain-containing protein [Actinoplanes sp. NPDC049548]|uniref:class I SAM-dependent methyltransferase n=1 Tax=Actinoplanes sp. NPDC049548 TaxID=3155152 RepID=UPI003437EEF5
MTDEKKVGIAVDDYDAAHAGVQASPLMQRLWAQAMGDDYPHGVEPFSACSWWMLGNIVATLRLRPGGRLVDLGCGRGGPGLWLARALSARLTGIDFSAVAVELASQRSADFVAPGQAEFRQGTFAKTGLPADYADGIVSVDALPFAPDRPAAFREARRILKPGGRFVLTVREQPAGADSWESMAAGAGLEVEQLLLNENHHEFWLRLFALWQSHADELRAELGERAAENFLLESRQPRSALEERPAYLMVLCRR